ncbi:MAG: polymerase sigma-70 factor, subfamily [Pseudonocardiales bacterium]|nr:polymerase sigma-70 factor, subfamily [Pseudonocardiales bacterium]
MCRMHDFLRVLYEDHHHSLLNFATRLTGDRAAAEDVVQETFLRAWRHPESFADGTSARGWLITVARNVVIDRVRAKTARPHETGEHEPEPVPDHAQHVVDALVMGAVLASLSYEHRRVLMELYYNGRTYNEAAVCLGVPAGTVKSRSHYALCELRRAFQLEAR